MWHPEVPVLETWSQCGDVEKRGLEEVGPDAGGEVVWKRLMLTRVSGYRQGESVPQVSPVHTYCHLLPAFTGNQADAVAQSSSFSL